MSSPGKSLSLDSYWHFLFFLLKTNRTGSRDRRKSADGDYRLADPQGADGHQAGLRGRCVSRTVFASWASLSFLALWVGACPRFPEAGRRRGPGERGRERAGDSVIPAGLLLQQGRGRLFPCSPLVQCLREASEDGGVYFEMGFVSGVGLYRWSYVT